MKILLIFPVALVVIFAAGGIFTFGYAWWVERHYPPTGAFMEVDGLRLHYVDKSPADGRSLGTVVLLHGASSNLTEAMLGIGTALTGRYRVVAFDRPGLGWTERGNNADMATPARQADILAQALRKLEVSNAVVVGHSWSGSLAPLFALDHTDVAGAILILSGVTHPWPGGGIAWYDHVSASWAGWFLTRTLAIPVGLMLFRSATEHTFAPQAVPPGFVERAQIPLLFRPGPFQSNGEDIAALYDAVKRQSIRYPEIRIPVTVIGGDADEIVWTDLHSRSFARDVPGTKLIVLPGIGHMPQYARPDLVLSEIEVLAERIATTSKAVLP
ncbi:alpha/beta fold hydrolase [Microvirga sp. 2TAF3]|uniref:alpha/beta fold hydrolase n=1 Tax=Microvirga sp. 2TAF3 TaxID=3233014 RepID=UPI003F94D1A6